MLVLPDDAFSPFANEIPGHWQQPVRRAYALARLLNLVDDEVAYADHGDGLPSWLQGITPVAYVVDNPALPELKGSPFHPDSPLGLHLTALSVQHTASGSQLFSHLWFHPADERPTLITLTGDHHVVRVVTALDEEGTMPPLAAQPPQQALPELPADERGPAYQELALGLPGYFADLLTCLMGPRRN